MLRLNVTFKSSCRGFYKPFKKYKLYMILLPYLFMHARILRAAKYLEYFIVSSLVILLCGFLYGLLGHKNMT